MNRLLLILTVCLTSGCAGIKHHIFIPGVEAPKESYVENHLQKDNYPGFLAAEGNIYSCRYGIHFMSHSELPHPKDVIFASMFAKYHPEITKHKIKLHRFDIYYNWRIRALKNAAPAVGAAVGGVLGSTIQSSIDGYANTLHGSYVYEDLLVEVNPEKMEVKDEDKFVGCRKRDEGEYLAGVVSKGHDVVVSRFKFELDGTEYSFKTYHQTNWGTINDAVNRALRMSFKAMGERLPITSSP